MKQIFLATAGLGFAYLPLCSYGQPLCAKIERNTSAYIVPMLASGTFHQDGRRANATQFSTDQTGTGGLVNYSIPGWSLSAPNGSSVGTGLGSSSLLISDSSLCFQDNFRKFALSKSISNVNLTGSGAIFDIEVGLGNGYGGGLKSVFNVYYAGTLYATVTTTDGPGTSGTVSYSNGASGNRTTLPINSNKASNWSVYLPTSIANSGTLKVEFVPSASSESVAADDVLLRKISVKSCAYYISGTVFNDANGLKDNLINGIGFNPGNLKVALYNAGGYIVPNTTVAVQVDGTFAIEYPGNSTGSGYTVRLVDVPGGYLFTGEGFANQPSGDGTANGRTSGFAIADANNNVNITGLKFGLNRRPVAPHLMYNITAPAIGTQHFFNGTVSDNSLDAIYSDDQEDGIIAANKSVKISGLNGMNGNALYYNNVEISSNITIANFDPALLSVKYVGQQSTGFSFEFNVADAAGEYAQQNGTYTVSWSAPLSVKISQFKVSHQNDLVNLEWITTQEENNREFQVEHSSDGRIWNLIGVVSSKSSFEKQNSTITYEFAHRRFNQGKNIYRVLSVDYDGTTAISDSRVVVIDNLSNVKVFPNPATNVLQIEGLRDSQNVKIFNSVGTRLNCGMQRTGFTGIIDISSLASGWYSIQITEADEIKSNHKISVMK